MGMCFSICTKKLNYVEMDTFTNKYTYIQSHINLVPYDDIFVTAHPDVKINYNVLRQIITQINKAVETLYHNNQHQVMIDITQTIITLKIVKKTDGNDISTIVYNLLSYQ